MGNVAGVEIRASDSSTQYDRWM